jgi:hypothetical protein
MLLRFSRIAELIKNCLKIVAFPTARGADGSG